MYEFYSQTKQRAAAAIAAGLMLTAAGMPAGTVSAQDDAKPVSLMCLGDSITDGFWLTGGYRNTLCAHITENGQEQAVDFVGPNWGGSGYDPQHAGYSGYSIDNIAQEDSISGQRTGISSFVDWLMESYPADVVFLQIGTNDILSLYDLDHFGDRLEGLVDSILGTLPADGCLYLATLPVMDATNNLYISDYFFTVESMDAAVEQCNTQIRALAQKKAAEGKPVILANINGVLTKSDLYDGVHPSEAGYQKMGDFWYARLNEYLSGQAQTTQPIVTETTTAVTETTTTPVQTTTSAQTTTQTETTTQTVQTTTAPPLPPQRGDVNLDGTVSAADAVALSEILTRQRTADAKAAQQADMDENGKLNAVDLTLLKRAL